MHTWYVPNWSWNNAKLYFYQLLYQLIFFLLTANLFIVREWNTLKNIIHQPGRLSTYYISISISVFTRYNQLNLVLKFFWQWWGYYYCIDFSGTAFHCLSKKLERQQRESQSNEQVKKRRKIPESRDIHTN